MNSSHPTTASRLNSIILPVIDLQGPSSYPQDREKDQLAASPCKNNFLCVMPCTMCLYLACRGSDQKPENSLVALCFTATCILFSVYTSAMEQVTNRQMTAWKKPHAAATANLNGRTTPRVETPSPIVSCSFPRLSLTLSDPKSPLSAWTRGCLNKVIGRLCFPGPNG